MTDWTKRPNVPRGDLYAWHQYEEGVSADGVANDYSGDDRHYTTASNKSVLTPDVLNGQPGWYFNGSRNPMLWNSTVAFKHVFILASAEEATFGDFRGLLSDSTSVSLLVGDDATDKFLDFSGTFTSEYRKSDAIFAANNEKAPMAFDAQVIELKVPAGVVMDAMQIGKETNLNRRWKGYWFEDLYYSEIKNDVERQRIYEYFAERYKVWPRSSSGLFVFPFAANKTRSVDIDQESYVSQPYSGEPKELVRGGYRGAYELPFLLREQEEFDAAKAFLAQHGRTRPFVIRDYRYYPFREVTVRCTSSIKEQGSDVTYRFNYAFDVMEV